MTPFDVPSTKTVGSKTNFAQLLKKNPIKPSMAENYYDGELVVNKLAEKKKEKFDNKKNFRTITVQHG